MVTGAILAGVIFLVAQGTQVSAMTNREFYELLEPYAIDVVDDEISSASSDMDVEVPGGPDDELDMENLVRSMIPDSENMLDSPLGYHARPDLRRIHGKCHCRKYDCSCCLSYTFRFFWKKLYLKACGEVAYLPHEIGVEMTITLNNIRVFHHKISLRNPPPLCFGVPGLRCYARVCLEVYDIKFSTFHMCLRLKGVVNLWIKKFEIHWKLGCFQLRHLDGVEFMEMLKSGEILEIKEVGGSDVTAHDLAEAFLNLLQMKKSEEMSFTEI